MNAEKILDKGIDEEKIEVLADKLASSDYEKEVVRHHLDLDLDNTLEALVWASKSGKLNIKESAGKKPWQIVIGYLFENGKTEELYKIEGELYEIHSPNKKESSDIHSDSKGLFLMGLTLGTIGWDDVSNKRKRRKYHEFVMKHIYSKD